MFLSFRAIRAIPTIPIIRNIPTTRTKWTLQSIRLQSTHPRKVLTALPSLRSAILTFLLIFPTLFSSTLRADEKTASSQRLTATEIYRLFLPNYEKSLHEHGNFASQTALEIGGGEYPLLAEAGALQWEAQPRFAQQNMRVGFTNTIEFPDNSFDLIVLRNFPFNLMGNIEAKGIEKVKQDFDEMLFAYLEAEMSVERLEAMAKSDEAKARQLLAEIHRLLKASGSALIITSATERNCLNPIKRFAAELNFLVSDSKDVTFDNENLGSESVHHGIWLQREKSELTSKASARADCQNSL